MKILPRTKEEGSFVSVFTRINPGAAFGAGTGKNKKPGEKFPAFMSILKTFWQNG